MCRESGQGFRDGLARIEGTGNEVKGDETPRPRDQVAAGVIHPDSPSDWNAGPQKMQRG